MSHDKKDAPPPRVARAAIRAVGALARAKKAAAKLTTRAVKRLNELPDWMDSQWDSRIDEDEILILDQCPIVQGLLDRSTDGPARSLPQVPVTNVHVRAVMGAALLSAAGAGALAFEGTLAGLTRSVFDSDRLVGKWAQHGISAVAGDATVDAVNRFMDTVPGAAYAGGGWLHRLQHGHDLSSVVEAWSTHGLGGAVQAAYHIGGRDFFTPAGVPRLPFGSESALKFLTESVGLKPLQAADLLSINAIELLGGIATISGLVRLVSLVLEQVKDAQMRRKVEAAAQALQENDVITGTSLLREVAVQRQADPVLRFAFAEALHRSGDNLAAHFEYERVLELGASDEPIIAVGGAGISLRGLAAIGGLATAGAFARDAHQGSGWPKRVNVLATTGFHAFFRVADQHADRRLVREGLLSAKLERVALPPRYLSAALNYYLAGELVGRAMFLADSNGMIELAAARADEQLAGLESVREVRQRLDEVRRLRTTIRLELAQPAVA